MDTEIEMRNIFRKEINFELVLFWHGEIDHMPPAQPNTMKTSIRSNLAQERMLLQHYGTTTLHKSEWQSTTYDLN